MRIGLSGNEWTVFRTKTAILPDRLQPSVDSFVYADPPTIRWTDEDKSVNSNCEFEHSMKSKVYVETTIVSYLVASPTKDLVQAAHQRVTRE